MIKTYQFSLPSITCASCVSSIDDIVAKCPKIKILSFNTDLLEKRLKVIVEDDYLTETEIRKIICDEVESGGFDCEDDSPVVYQAAVNSPLPSVKKQKERFNRWHLIKGLIGLAFGIALLVLSVLGVGIPLLAMILITVIGTITTLAIGANSYIDAVKKLVKAKTLTMDALFAISTLAALAISIVALFVPGLPMMLDAALLIFGFRYVGKLIEDAAKNKVISNTSFCERAGNQIEKIVGDQLVNCNLGDIRVGDVIYVRRGQIIPLDGKSLESDSAVYKSIFTGQQKSYRVRRDEKLYAGMVANAEFMHIQVTATHENSYLARLDKMTEKAHMEKAPLETLSTKVLSYFIPTVLIIALILGICLGIFFPPLIAVQCVIGILVAACPCTLGIIVPIAVRVGVNKAADNGVHFKSGKSLQAAEQIDTVVFDLNGTLTTGEIAITDVKIVADDITEEEILAYLIALEEKSQHLVAQAIRQHAKSKMVVMQYTAENLQVSHSGIEGDIGGQQFIVGNLSMLAASGIDTSQLITTNQEAQQKIYLARDNKIIATLILQDTLRAEAKTVIHQLQQQGKQVHLCTGADKVTAEYYAQQLGISLANVQADCIPIDEPDSKALSKVAYIKSLQKKNRKVSMIGDAGNDAVSVKKSNFGIAMRSNASDEMTLKKAGAVIESASLMPVLTTFVVAKETINNIKQNLFFSLGYNMAVMIVPAVLLLTIGFMLNPGIGVALMILQVGLVLLNVYRLKASKMSHLTPAATENKITSEVAPEPDLQLAPTYSTVSQAFGVEVRKVDELKTMPFTQPIFATVRAPLVGARSHLVDTRTQSCGLNKV